MESLGQMKKNGMGDECYLSIVVPLYNEEANIQVLFDELSSALENLKERYEIIFVDDGSEDETWREIKRISDAHSFVVGIKLARNFGHQHALLAGLNNAKGQAIVTMDGDLQHPPSTIKEMVKKHKEGFIVVNTRRYDEQVASFFKRKTSSLFYKIFSFLADVPMSQGASDFRLMDRLALNYLLELRDVDLFLRGAIEWLGFPSTTISYRANRRNAGSSKYTISKMLKFARGAIISFSSKPLVIGIWAGIATGILSFVEVGYVFIKWWNGETVPGWASTLSVVSFLFGMLFIMLGIIGSYLARIHVALQNRPRFVISEVVGR